jgi:hypothetical protein
MYSVCYFCPILTRIGAFRDTRWGTALQTGRSRVRFRTESLEFFSDLILSGHIVALGSTQPLTEMSTRSLSWGWRRPVRRADNLTTYMCRLSINSGASASRNPKGLSRPVAGKLYLLSERSTDFSNKKQIWTQRHLLGVESVWYVTKLIVFFFFGCERV